MELPLLNLKIELRIARILRNCRLYSCIRLICTSKTVSASASGRIWLCKGGESLSALALDGDKAVQHGLIVGVTLQLLERGEIGEPAVAAQKLGEEGRRAGGCTGQSAALCDAVGLVLEPLGPNGVPIL